MCPGQTVGDAEVAKIYRIDKDVAGTGRKIYSIPGAKMGRGCCLPRQVNSCAAGARQVKKERTAARTGR
jgi:hypothetical protein